MSELKPCPFCGGTPEVLQRPDTLDGYFCAISCFCGGYSARAHQAATSDTKQGAYEKAKQRWNRRPAEPNEPLTLEELRGMDRKPVWWWNKSSKPQLVICSLKPFDKTPKFIAFDWDEQDCTEIINYQTLIKRGYKAYRHKPESEEV